MATNSPVPSQQGSGNGDSTPQQQQQFPPYPQFVVPGVVPGVTSPILTPGQSPFLQPTLSPQLQPADAIAYQIYMQQMYQLQMQAQMQGYMQAVAQQQAFASLSPTTSPNLSAVPSEPAALLRRRSKRGHLREPPQPAAVPAPIPEEAKDEGADAPENDNDHPVAGDEQEGQPAAAAPPGPRALAAREIINLLVFGIFLFSMSSSDRTMSSYQSMMPFAVIAGVILWKIIRLIFAGKPQANTDATPDDAILRRPGPSLTQPPPGLAFDVFAAVLHFFMSIVPSWTPPDRIVDERAELEALLRENEAAAAGASDGALPPIPDPPAPVQ